MVDCKDRCKSCESGQCRRYHLSGAADRVSVRQMLGSQPGHREEQIKQSNANAEAFGDAAEDAANRIGDRAATESTIDNAVEQVKDKIGNAKSPTAIRNAVLDSLCRKPSHRDDPACAVQPPDPG